MKVPSQNIQVAVRIRNIPSWHGRDPNSVKNTEEHNKNITLVNSRSISTGISTQITINDPEQVKDPKEFNYDYVFSGEDNQEIIFDKIVKNMITRCLNGYNGCIFTYGQTASGKTYTMGGPAVDDPKDRGIIQRVAEFIVQHIEKHSRTDSSKGGVDYEVVGSYLEIYNEELRDLLKSSTDPNEDLKIRLDPKSVSGKDLAVVGLKQVPLVTESDYIRTIETAIARRAVAETNMNAVSSRSHSVFTLTIVQNDRFVDMLGNTQLGIKKRSKLHLIDLAGSERIESTGATGQRLKEGAAINQSLSCLGNVINALSTQAKFVPYRDSKLTYLLSDSLGGNSLTLMIACVTPIAGAYEESIGTLRFAERAKKIINNAQVNVDAVTLRIMALEAENAELKDLLSKCVCVQKKRQSIPNLTNNPIKNSRVKMAAFLTFGSKVAPSSKDNSVEELSPSDDTPSAPKETIINISHELTTQNLGTKDEGLPVITVAEPKNDKDELKQDEYGTEGAKYEYENYLRQYRETYKDELPKYRNKYIKIGFCQVFAAILLMVLCMAFGLLVGYGIFFVPQECHMKPLHP